MTRISKAAHQRSGTMTPTGVQSLADLSRRRWLLVALSSVIYIGLIAAMASLLAKGGWTAPEGAILACFALVAPWSVLGFCNAALGLWLLHGTGNAIARVAPYAQVPDAPLTHSTAIVMTLRNEDTSRALARLRAVAASVEATGMGAAFGYFILSDTADAAIAASEEQGFTAWQRACPTLATRMTYRRRSENTGFKAGNIRDFCTQFGANFTFMLPLDADSFMDGATITRMVQIGQAHERLGILQSLVVGAPSSSAFARIFQFGMRQGMRPYTVGSAWWGGDCGQFWGHNALVRIAPFMRHCALPVLPGPPPLGGAILSHDQVEAVLMRRAGFEVRVLPVECGSFEDNPPTLLEFSRRDQRWCHGNMQYFALLGLPGLLATSRFQLTWAIAMFIGQPAFNLLLLLLALRPLEESGPGAPSSDLAMALYASHVFLMIFPKLAGFADIALTGGELARYGGALRFFGGALVELVFSFLISAIISFRTASFLVMQPFGRTTLWSGQARDAHALGWRTAGRQLWPASLFGLMLLAAMAATKPGLMLWALPYVAGLVLAVPLTVISSWPGLGRALQRWQLCAIPEELGLSPYQSPRGDRDTIKHTA